MLVRSKSVADTMSRYLIQRIEENPLIEMHYSSELTGLEGDGHLEQVSWIDKESDGDIDPSDPACFRDGGRITRRPPGSLDAWPWIAKASCSPAATWRRRPLRCRGPCQGRPTCWRQACPAFSWLAMRDRET